MTTTATHISLPSDLLAAYRAAGGPPLSGLCADALRTWLGAHGHEVPPEPAPGRTAAASAARWTRIVALPGGLHGTMSRSKSACPECGAAVNDTGSCPVAIERGEATLPQDAAR